MSFNIIKFRNGRKTAEIDFGDGITYTVHKKDKIYVPELNYNMPTPDYQTHFIFENPTNKVGTPIHICTCGSPVVWVGSDMYKKDEVPHGAMFVCFSHVTYGKHLDGSV